MKTSEIVMLAGVAFIGFELFKSSQTAAAAQTGQLTPEQQAQINYQNEVLQGRQTQQYISTGTSLLGTLANLFRGNSSPGFSSGSGLSYVAVTPEHNIYSNSGTSYTGAEPY